jgi:type I restriction enzyme S subunit
VGTPYYKVEQLGRASKYLARASTPYFSTTVPEVPVGSVLIAKRGAAIALNRVRLLTEPSFMDTNVMALTPRDDLEPEFLYYWLSHRGLWDIADVTSVPQINNKHIIPLEILLPSPSEQKQIAKVLSDADDLVATLGRMLAKKEAMRQGMAQELLTGHTRLPGFSDRWSRVNLGAHVSYLKTVPLSRAQLDTTSAVRCLHYGDIHTTTDVYLDAAKAPMPRATRLLVEAAGRLDVGDLVLADASEDPDGVGKSVEITAVPPEGAVAGLHTIAARFDRAVLADGFKAYLQFNPQFRRALLRLAAGTKVLATTRAYISSVLLDLPAAEEQQAIARVLSDVDDEIRGLDRRLEKAKAIKQGMAQQLLTGRVRLPVLEAIA